VKVVMVAMGAQNVSLEILSAVLKQHGHQTELVFDRAMFDDKQYMTVGFLKRLFSDRKYIEKQLREMDADLFAFNVFTDNYKWSLEMATYIKQHRDTPIIFGGIHPTIVPERVMRHQCVDYICIGEGEEAILELVEQLEAGKPADNIPNIWSRVDGNVKSNAPRPQQPNLDNLPRPDKDLFAKAWPLKGYCITVTNRGCIYSCSYCMENFKKKWESDNQLGAFIRERSVDAVIAELKELKEKYGVRYIDIKNNILSASRKWTAEFCERYPKEVGVPFRIMGHPITINEWSAPLLKSAGCHHVQLGVESMNARIRKDFLLRSESTEEITGAIEAMETAGIKYSCDFILGLPGETEADLVQAIEMLANKRRLIRASVFWLEYLPKVAITDMALGEGLIDDAEVDKIEEGKHLHYMSTGSMSKGSRMTLLRNYHLLFRLLPVLPAPLIRLILKTKLHHLFRYLPQSPILAFVDVVVSYIKNDKWAKFAMYSYAWELKRRAGSTRRQAHGG
jgi:radical SAM superfamily enzyme YgiQ (UPF0313 family)